MKQEKYEKAKDNREKKIELENKLEYLGMFEDNYDHYKKKMELAIGIPIVISKKNMSYIIEKERNQTIEIIEALDKVFEFL